MRISVTDLETYREYVRSPAKDLAWVLGRLRRKTPPSDAMLAGRAFHRALERIQRGGAVDEVSMDGFTFRFQADIDLDLPVIRETRIRSDIQTGHGPVTLSGIIDAQFWDTIYDHKLAAWMDLDNYHRSYQWRCYLVMSGANRFVYNIFIGEVPKDEPRVREIVGFEPLTFYRYPGIDEDVARQAGQFAQFLAGLPDIDTAGEKRIYGVKNH